MSGPSLTEITNSLKEMDGSGTGILTAKQARLGLSDIENLPFSKEEISEHIELAQSVAGDGNGKIKLDVFANYLAFEVVKKRNKMKKNTHLSTKTPKRQNNNNLTTQESNPFLDLGFDEEPTTNNTTPSNSNNMPISPSAVLDIPEWFGHSIDSPMGLTGPVLTSPSNTITSTNNTSTTNTNDTSDDFFGFLGPPTNDSNTNSKSKDDSNALQLRTINNDRQSRNKSTPSVHKSGKKNKGSNNGGGGGGLIAPPRKKGQRSKSPKRYKSPRSKSPGPMTSFSFAMHFEDESEVDEVFSPRKNGKSGSDEEVQINNPPTKSKPESNGKSKSHHEVSSEKPEKQKHKSKEKERKHKKRKRRQRTDAIAEMKRGSAMLKYGRRGFPHFRRFQLSRDNTRLLWYSKKKSIKETNILVRDVKDVLEGQQTEVFRQCTQRTLEKASFSIVYGEKLKTLDLVAKSFEEAQLWIKGLKGLMRANKHGKLTKVAQILVDCNYTDISKPNYREKDVDLRPGQGYGNQELLRTVESTLEQTRKTFRVISELTQKDSVIQSEEYGNIQTIVSEIEQRIEEMEHALTHKSMSLANLKRDVWVLKVDVTVLEEKLKVIQKSERKWF